MKQQSPQFKRKRKMLLLMPFIAIPFVTVIFWSLGGGQNVNAENNFAQKGGINLKLPDAQLSNAATDKLTLYDQALKDSVQLEEERKSDPSYNSLKQSDAFSPDSAWGSYEADGSSSNGLSPYEKYGSRSDVNERKVQERLANLQRTLQQSQTAGYPEPETNYPDNGQSERLQNALDNLQNIQSANNSGGDPEIDKINTMLQKVIDIQHPDAARKRLEAASLNHKAQVFSLEEPDNRIEAKLLAAGNVKDSFSHPLVGFYESENGVSDERQDNKAVTAVVNETQTLVSGNTIKMRLTQTVFINAVEIPKGTFVYGACRLDGERLKVEITIIRYKDKLFPVALTVYDLDGLPGIRIPGAISRDAGKEGLNQGIQAMNIMSMDPSIGAQAATAGIEATKSLLSHKAKLVRATVKAGYPILLADNNKKNNSE